MKPTTDESTPPKTRSRSKKENPSTETKTPETTPAATSEAPAKKATRSRAKKPAKAVEEAPEPVAELKAEAKAVASKKKATRAKAKVAGAVEPEPEAIEATKPKRARTARSKKAAPVAEAEPQETVWDDERDIIVTFRAPSRAAGGSKRQESSSAEGDREEKPSRGRGRQRKGAKADVVETPAPVEAMEFDSGGYDLPVPSWRPLEKGKAKPATEETAPAEAPAKRSPRGREGRTPRESRRPLTAPAPSSQTLAPAEEPQAPAIPSKPLIPIPPDAPQVVMRDGIPTLVRNHRVYPPMFFFGNPSDERRAQTVLEQIRMAADAGVHLHAHLIELEVDPKSVDLAVSFAAFMLARSVDVDPEAQVLFRIVFKAPRGWQDRYPSARWTDFYGNEAEPSVCDDEFWSVAVDCLDSFVRQLRLLPYRDQILGVQLDRGEWFMGEDAGYDDSRAAQQKFREWARTRYSNDEVTLRASWFDGSVRFDNVQVPAFSPEPADGERFIRSSRKLRKYVDYHLFLSDATVHRIGELAYAAKEASEGYFLVGASYGYTFEWSHPSSGHLSLGKLLRTPEVDFIAGPPSYRTREPGGAAPFPGPIDSFALNGKLYISEEDFKTSLAIGHEPDDFNPQLRTPQALENVHWRGGGAALAHGAGTEWMDLWGNGWLKTPSVWERAARVQRALIDRMEAPVTDPDVAVFIDERALAYLVEPHAFQLLVQNVRESVLRAGVSAGFYLLSDLAHREKFPESKLYIFLNAWDIRPELRAAIKNRLQKDGKVLFWLYSAGLFDAGRDSLERAREVTGIALKPQPFHSRSGTTILNKRHPLSEAFPDRNVGGIQLEPSYFAIPEGATILGEYTQTGLPSFVVKEFNEGPSSSHWTSVFLGEPQVNPALIRGLAQMAGVHVWNFQDDVVHVRPPFLTVHCTGPGSRTIAMPTQFSAYNVITEEWVGEGSNVRLSATDGSTLMLLVGPKPDVEHLLKYDPASRLKMDELPARDANERHDASSFDVPIMRLDEWMGGADTDEVADEWFLRPPQVQDEPEQATESPERIGRRRRRRGPRESGEPSGARVETFTASAEEDFDLNVMFRKRS